MEGTGKHEPVQATFCQRRLIPWQINISNISGLGQDSLETHLNILPHKQVSSFFLFMLIINDILISKVPYICS